MLMVAWAFPVANGAAMGLNGLGGVLPSLVLMVFHGADVGG